jgi:hypothetical protein
MTTAQLDFATPAPTTEQFDDTELRRFTGADGGRRMTLGRKLEQTWEGLRAAGVANCPLCGGRMERRAAHARCGCCGTRLS